MAHQPSLGTSENKVPREQGIDDRVNHVGGEEGRLRNRSGFWDTDEYRVYWNRDSRKPLWGGGRRNYREEEGAGGSISSLDGTF